MLTILQMAKTDRNIHLLMKGLKASRLAEELDGMAVEECISTATGSFTGHAGFNVKVLLVDSINIPVV